ncbi:MAG: hypothetical protein LUG12_12675 [Erysipelotrichaceae bacterium]|nr:hypothetical protein [Erysipelotrichaceae bacterium]
MRRILKYIVLLMLNLSLTGCMKYTINITVNEDMTSETAMELLVQDSILQAMNMTSEEFYESFEEEYLNSESLESASVTQITNDDWSGVSITGLTLDDSISTTISEEKIDDVDSIIVTIPINDIISVIDFESYGYSLEDLQEAGMEIVLNVTMPSAATSNIGEVNDKTVTIDLLELMYSDSQEENIIISSAIPNDTIIYIAIGAVMIAVISFIVLKKKRII